MRFLSKTAEQENSGKKEKKKTREEDTSASKEYLNLHVCEVESLLQ